jgi:hypothetical protein
MFKVNNVGILRGSTTMLITRSGGKEKPGKMRALLNSSSWGINSL